jgi:hypothetical protein
MAVIALILAKSYLVHKSFENNYIDFHENLTKRPVANTKSGQSDGQTDVI